MTPSGNPSPGPWIATIDGCFAASILGIRQDGRTRPPENVPMTAGTAASVGRTGPAHNYKRSDPFLGVCFYEYQRPQREAT
jgi:hypothetical protein